ncbi:uncharacterized protein LOC102561859 isoform X2 [Alligator mississippiensis]|uniref:uncharacterized protein LOC102561859 isoform X2 n=1 Tax=Alligator mississippiensis TaxID=8496 RepID=UPI0028774100|nr:uncharacterized protein LOC102561859 isoform X2 [Alligator mississippiensis]
MEMKSPPGFPGFTCTGLIGAHADPCACCLLPRVPAALAAAPDRAQPAMCRPRGAASCALKVHFIWLDPAFPAVPSAPWSRPVLQPSRAPRGGRNPGGDGSVAIAASCRYLCSACVTGPRCGALAFPLGCGGRQHRVPHRSAGLGHPPLSPLLLPLCLCIRGKEGGKGPREVTSSPKQDQPRLHHPSQGFVYRGLKHLQGWRLHHLSGEPPVSYYPPRETAFPNIEPQFPLLQLEPIAHLCKPQSPALCCWLPVGGCSSLSVSVPHRWVARARLCHRDVTSFSASPSLSSGLEDGHSVTAPSALPTTVPSSVHPNETGGFSTKATAPPVTGRDRDTATTQLGTTGLRTLGPEEPSLPPSLRAATEAEGLQTPVATSAPDATTGLRNESQAANSSLDVPSPPPTANATELSQPGREGAEPTGTPGQLGARTEAPTSSTPQDSPATQGRAQPPSGFSTLGPTTGRPDPVPGTAHEGATKESNTEPATIPATEAGLATTASSTVTRTSVAASTTTTTTVIAIGTTIRTPPAAVTRQAVDPVHEKAPVLDVGDEEDQELPSSPVTGVAGADPLVIAVISVFIIMVGVLGLVGFLKYRQHSSRMEFRRLQDLPMDDMMEDTPLSLYSY